MSEWAAVVGLAIIMAFLAFVVWVGYRYPDAPWRERRPDVPMWRYEKTERKEPEA